LVKGTLVGNKVVIFNVEKGRDVYGRGFYGKPIGVPKPKGVEFESPLVLDLMEGAYLMSKGELEVETMEGKKVELSAMLKMCEKDFVGFREKFAVYRDLRDKGYIVLPGIKFGSDFAVYERGPGVDHAPYLVDVRKPEELLTAPKIVLSGRLATAVKKQFIVAVAEKDGRVEYLSFEWWR